MNSEIIARLQRDHVRGLKSELEQLDVAIAARTAEGRSADELTAERTKLSLRIEQAGAEGFRDTIERQGRDIGSF